MPKWKRFLLIGAGFGAGFAAISALIFGGWTWYLSRPVKPKPWDSNEIVATFEFLGTETGQFADDPKAQSLVFSYTLENKTDVDYRMPAEGLQLYARLNHEKSLAVDSQSLSLDKERPFIPAKQRMGFTIHLHYLAPEGLDPNPKTAEDRNKNHLLLTKYLNEELTNLDGFAVFDIVNRYQIALPNGWSTKH